MRWETGGFELASTITLVSQQAHQLNIFGSHPIEFKWKKVSVFPQDIGKVLKEKMSFYELFQSEFLKCYTKFILPTVMLYDNNFYKLWQQHLF